MSHLSDETVDVDTKIDLGEVSVLELGVLGFQRGEVASNVVD